MAMQQIHLIITGRVQGVFFRAFVKDTAESFHITGWVRNNPDGSVEVVAQGDSEFLKRFVKACHDGPSAANVESVKAEERDATEEFENFEIMY